MPPIAVTLIQDRADKVAMAPAAQWAAGELERALAGRGLRVTRRSLLDQVPAGEAWIVAAGAPETLRARSGVPAPAGPESFVLTPDRSGGDGLVAFGAGVRGLVYALLELADCVALAEDPARALRLAAAEVRQPANRLRGVMRLFASDVEDSSWYHDPTFWQRYLTTLISQRFNRFHLALGLGYDFPRGIDDAYLYFSYPFLLQVPGYDVRATGVTDEERERNLESLRRIAREATGRGLHFQLGLWTHAYEMQESPRLNHTITGLTAENHAAYCRDALRLLLQQVPEIDGVTLRIHGESGVPERSYAFWREVFQGVATCGRRVDMDLHSKGIDQPMIDLALETGLPVTVSPKYWAEHLGLPYHQADIRPTEHPRPPRGTRGQWMALSEAERSFTRYGYADLLREDRRYRVLWRVWPGTQRLLLWGDPLFAAGYGRAAGFAGSDGMEWFDPLSFKGRKGSGLAGLHGQRGGYGDPSLLPEEGDWTKYCYTYRLLGRQLYDPATPAGEWRRWTERALGAAAGAAEAALGRASRILPLVTTAHLPSAANYHYWVELPINMSIVDDQRQHPYGDTPSPKRFGMVSPLDPQLFATPDETAAALVERRDDARYSALEVAAWLDDLAQTARRHVEDAGARQASGAPDPQQAAELRRWALDIHLMAGVGQYFAAKLRAAVAYGVFERTRSAALLREGLDSYRVARDAWADAAGRAGGAYGGDLTFGPVPFLRGHWLDRLPAMDEDIADMASLLQRAEAEPPAAADPEAETALQRWRAALEAAAGRRTDPPAVAHQPVASFTPGQDLAVSCTLPDGASRQGRTTVMLHYRHVTQAERWQVLEMAPGERPGAFQASVPAAYTDSPYALQYYFELRADGDAQLWPGVGAGLDQQPYFVVRQRR